MNTVEAVVTKVLNIRQSRNFWITHVEVFNECGYSELAAYWRGRWARLADFTKKEALSAAYEIANRLAEMFETECEALGLDVETMSNDDLDWLHQHLGREMLSLRVVPPAWGGEWDRERIFTAILRMSSPDWWGRKIWRLRCDWRENQLRAVGAVNKKAHAYVSASSLIEWQEQRRKNRDFFKSHELVDEDGNVSSLEDMINKSTSNPAIRRHELMARMAGVEMVAQQRGDVGIFLTITCPSKYHSNIQSGHHNAKWNHSTVSEAQRYLCQVWNVDHDGVNHLSSPVLSCYIRMSQVEFVMGAQGLK